MTGELGKIERPEVEQFKSKRKLLVVPLLFSGDDAPIDYMVKFNLYWEQAAQHIANLEARLGTVNRIYHESIVFEGEEGLKIIEKYSADVHRIAKDMIAKGGKLEATEDRALADETIDWERFIIIGIISEKVARLVSGYYTESLRKRYEYIANKINTTLKENESGILFIREGHMVQFPPDIEVFSVSPPALDDIHRWQRQRAEEEKAKEQAEETGK